METKNSLNNALICLVKNDVTNLLLLYRKIAGSNINHVYLETPYEGSLANSVSIMTVSKCLPNFTLLGPIPLYYQFVNSANFPSNVDIESYTGTVVNIDIVEHIYNGLHLEDIFPAQKTQYSPPYHINNSEFAKGYQHMTDTSRKNVALCIGDEIYDRTVVLREEAIYLLIKLLDVFNKPVNLHILGIGLEDKPRAISSMLQRELPTTADVNIIHAPVESFSYQLGVLLASELFITGPYNVGIASYGMPVPTISIIPYSLSFFKGKTISRSKPNNLYVELEDAEIDSSTVEIALDLIQKGALNNAKRTKTIKPEL